MRLGFCIALAVISAGLADPLVEFGSNAGWFGAGNFTDRSSIDVVPAILAGIVLLTLYFVRKARAVVAERSGSALGAVLPTIFALQMLALYVMETSEQLLVWHHPLGPTIWLGGPAPVSVAIHATICTIVAVLLARSKRQIARTTLRVIAIVTAIAAYAAPAGTPVARRVRRIRFKNILPVSGAFGERAPPVAAH